MSNFFAFWSEIPQGRAFPQYGPGHIILLSVVGIMIVLSLFLMRGVKKSRTRAIIRTCAVLEVLLELSHILWMYKAGQTDPIKLLPLHLCSMQMVLLPLAVFTRAPVLRELSLLTSFIGGILALVTPEGVANTYPLIHYQTLQTFALHGLLIFIPLASFFYDDFYPRLKNLPKVLLLLAAFILPAAYVDFFYGQNYMFLNVPPDFLFFLQLYHQFGHGAYLLSAATAICVLALLIYVPFEIGAKTRVKSGFRFCPPRPNRLPF